MKENNKTIKPSRPRWADGVGKDEFGFFADLNLNGVIQRMRWIPPGTFLMGSPESEVGRFSNEFQHEVTLTKSFWLADTTCTQELWEKVMGFNPSKYKGLYLPVERVDWHDCRNFFKKIRDLTKIKLTSPTEAQWEYACRAGTKTPFFFGENITTDQVNFDGGCSYNNVETYFDRTIEEKAFPCNAWGLYGMHGNVWEWCENWYEDYPEGPVIDPKGPDKGRLLVIRGGSWFNESRSARSANRGNNYPFDYYENIGFRFRIK